MYKTTEIASAEIPSDNVIHQRLLYPYEYIQDKIHGNVLEIGCGTGRGVAAMAPYVDHYTGVDKNTPLIEHLSAQYPSFTFIDMFLPPLKDLPSNHFDCIVSFQVIEHIENDDYFLAEAKRVLKPGGKFYLTTVNRLFSLTRNPWHVREYDAQGLESLMRKHFDVLECQGIQGNDKVQAYYEINKAAVRRITRFDIFDLQYRLPRTWLQVPYEWGNRLSRWMAKKSDDALVTGITTQDFSINSAPAASVDFFYTASKTQA